MNETLYTDGSSLELSGESLDEQNSNSPVQQTRGNGKSHLKKYLVILIVVLIALALLAVGLLIGHQKATTKTTETKVTVNTQSLDNGTLNTLTTKGSPDKTKQQLTISPDTLFINNVEVQQSVTVDKGLSVGDNLAVSGTTTLQGAVGINSSLAVRGGLSVGGSVTAGSLGVGSISATSLSLSGDLTIGGHIIPSGTAPSVKPSVADGGGTVVISGNDTAGTVTITTGGGASLAGELAIITFHSKFSSTPKVQLTPINPAASALNYYATRAVSFFSINTSSAVAPNTEYVFDYLVTQ